MPGSGTLGHVTYRPEMRASDDDRDRIGDRLRDAHSEGRLTPDEFDSRIDALLSAQTYGELEPLVRDLPAKPMSSAPVPAPPPATPSPAPAPQGSRRTNGQKALRAAWLAWTIAVSVNLVIWVMVSVTNGNLEYFWPIWVAGPWGAVLLAISGFRKVVKDE